MLLISCTFFKKRSHRWVLKIAFAEPEPFCIISWSPQRQWELDMGSFNYFTREATKIGISQVMSTFCFSFPLPTPLLSRKNTALGAFSGGHNAISLGLIFPRQLFQDHLYQGRVKIPVHNLQVPRNSLPTLLFCLYLCWAWAHYMWVQEMHSMIFSAVSFK